MRRCSRCEQVKPANEFANHAWCRGCLSVYSKGLKKTPESKARHAALEAQRRASSPAYLRERASRIAKCYGITIEDYARIINRQGGDCASCGDELDMGKKTCIDHCHRTGRVRGILCANCNFAVGHVKESAERARKIAHYIEGWEPKP